MNNKDVIHATSDLKPARAVLEVLRIILLKILAFKGVTYQNWNKESPFCTIQDYALCKKVMR